MTYNSYQFEQNDIDYVMNLMKDTENNSKKLVEYMKQVLLDMEERSKKGSKERVKQVLYSELSNFYLSQGLDREKGIVTDKNSVELAEKYVNMAL